MVNFKTKLKQFLVHRDFKFQRICLAPDICSIVHEKRECNCGWGSTSRSVKKCIYPLLLALKELELERATAGGPYKKTYSGYFLGTLYLLGDCAPHS